MKPESITFLKYYEKWLSDKRDASVAEFINDNREAVGVVVRTIVEHHMDAVMEAAMNEDAPDIQNIIMQTVCTSLHNGLALYLCQKDFSN